ncbi:MAG: hypothetical protein DI585_03475 [Pseudomonas fluorescens]|nr:MAG: hypothetical protein DI585_03475 [Pseudomonas fluorescens]
MRALIAFLLVLASQAHALSPSLDATECAQQHPPTPECEELLSNFAETVKQWNEGALNLSCNGQPPEECAHAECVQKPELKGVSEDAPEFKKCVQNLWDEMNAQPQ